MTGNARKHRRPDAWMIRIHSILDRGNQQILIWVLEEQLVGLNSPWENMPHRQANIRLDIRGNHSNLCFNHIIGKSSICLSV